MPFKVENTNISGLKIIYPHVFMDERGKYRKYFEKEVFIKNELPYLFNESSDIVTKKGSLRGLHYQTIDSQGKLLHVIKGKIFDVAVDLRKDSITFGKWKAFELSDKEDKLIYIPEGFAHGFLAIEDTVFTYMCTGKYVPEACGGIIWNDSTLNIPWPINYVEELILSDKDKNLQTFEQYKLNN